MKNPRPTCPNEHCENHSKPPADFYRKSGYYLPKHNHQPVPQYKCKACGKQFSATQSKAIRTQHRPDLNEQIFKMAVSGTSMRRMSELLGCSRTTISRKIVHLAKEARKHHALHLGQMKTGYVMFDELETFVHTRWKQLSVPMAIRAKTGEVISFGVARIPSKMVEGITLNRWVLDQRPVIVPAVLARVRPVLKPDAVVASDKETQYPKWMAQALPDVKHQPTKAVKGPGNDPLFSVNHAFAKLRNDLARLSRKTWTTTKSIRALENHLWLWVAWTNGYRLK